MALLSNDLLLAWSSLIPRDQSNGWQVIPIEPAGLIEVYAGKFFPGGHEAILACFKSAPKLNRSTLPDGQGFAVDLLDLNGDKQVWISLTKKEGANSDLFLEMVTDLHGLLKASSSTAPNVLMNEFISRVRAWQEFMRKGSGTLSPEAEIGLIGELLFLEKMFACGVDPSVALSSWVGPYDAAQDFHLGRGAVEVKSTASSASFVAKFHSLDQLDDSVRSPLYVVGYCLEHSQNGRSLVDLIGHIKQTLLANQEATRLFVERLLASGYLSEHDANYSRKFQQVKVLCHLVDVDFPKLTAGNVPCGIFNVQYSLNFESLSSAGVTIDETLSKLEVF